MIGKENEREKKHYKSSHLICDWFRCHIVWKWQIFPKHISDLCIYMNLAPIGTNLQLNSRGRN